MKIVAAFLLFGLLFAGGMESATAADTVKMNQPMYIGGFDYSLTSIQWVAKTDPKAAPILKESGCYAKGANGLLSFTFAIKNEQTAEGSPGQMAIWPTYKDGTAPQMSIGMGGVNGIDVFWVCNVPEPTKSNPIVTVKFGNGMNDKGHPNYFYMNNPVVTK